MPKEPYIPCLLGLFRKYGYDGATLAKISEATGLGKASLYHHFPGGKDEMVETVLNYLKQWMEQNIVQRLQATGEPVVRLQQMCDRLCEVYDGGKQPCLSAILLMGSARDVFHEQVQALYQQWIDAIAHVLREAGMERTQAQQRGEDALIAIQGSLLLAQALNKPVAFQRVMQKLPHELLDRSTPSQEISFN